MHLQCKCQKVFVKCAKLEGLTLVLCRSPIDRRRKFEAFGTKLAVSQELQLQSGCSWWLWKAFTGTNDIQIRALVVKILPIAPPSEI